MSQLQKGDLYNELRKQGHFHLVSSSGHSRKKIRTEPTLCHPSVLPSHHHLLTSTKRSIFSIRTLSPCIFSAYKCWGGNRQLFRQEVYCPQQQAYSVDKGNSYTFILLLTAKAKNSSLELTKVAF